MQNILYEAAICAIASFRPLDANKAIVYKFLFYYFFLFWLKLM